MERIDLSTGKKARSFQRQDGTIKFIERACELCERTNKKDQWHFSFECPIMLRCALLSVLMSATVRITKRTDVGTLTLLVY